MSPLVDPLLSTLDLSKPGMHSGAIAQSRLAQPWQVGVDFVVLKPWHKIASFDGSKKSAIGGSSSLAHGGETRRFLHFVCLVGQELQSDDSGGASILDLFDH